ncbi:MAG: BrnT family toxin [Bryobacterales bacterium]|nr:BrnT family toxin [Bryobacterales bacterium]MBV9399777.1 BrnT family toxin [Bryobacterales bacterium]
MEFEWDPAKSRSNRKKHGVDFETAARVFNDTNFLLIEGRIGEDGQQRWHALGMSGDIPLLVVVHVYKETENGEEIIRIISARKASARESRRYFR